MSSMQPFASSPGTDMEPMAWMGKAVPPSASSAIITNGWMDRDILITSLVSRSPNVCGPSDSATNLTP